MQLDNEFKSKDLLDYLESKGITLRYSSPYTPKQNGATKIVNKILFNINKKIYIHIIPSNTTNNNVLF